MSKVLIVEDDAVLQQMYQDQFVYEGFQVAVAGDGGEALTQMRVFQPDIVLLDLMLPTMTGFDVIDTVHADPELSKIPLLVLTNIFADGEDLVKNKGVKSFLLKSNTTPGEVVKKVKSLL